MTEALKQLEVVKVIVFGGTGAQGLSIVKALAPYTRYELSILTRDPGSQKAIEVRNKYDVRLIAGSYATEGGLRTAFKDQDVCYFNIDSFAVGEPQEYFWTFRAYEIAIQSQLKLFIYTGSGRDRLADHGFAEAYRNSHNVVSSRLSQWLATQSVERLPWSIVHGGVYAEMLNTLLRPVKDEQGIRFAPPVNKDSVIPLIPLEMYGIRVRWILENPEKSIGKRLSAASFHVTFPEIAAAFSKVNSVAARFEPSTIDEWMSKASASIPVDDTLPRGSSKDDPTTFTFRKSFTAWWNLWRDSLEDMKEAEEADRWADEYYPERLKTIEEWMRMSNYGSSLS
ncbi:hypothetical protein H2200_002367 [Cladophialophora chaetospira]|uniref:NmrA-like domain-containing protein n=1 Tax=Cladophialophora chaetospira TaxID=386627 RepID=A0AA38XJP7_9EURO|nr:hypothetical protein H2200_002367 [Cladophialophora chaetospira]